MKHWAGEGAGYPIDRLDLGGCQLAKGIDVLGLDPNDHVVGSGNTVSGEDTFDLTDRRRDRGLFADLGLDQNVRFDHFNLLGG